MLFGCSDDSQETGNPSVFGTWWLDQRYSDTGQVVKVNGDDLYWYEILADSTFRTNLYYECIEGEVIISDTQIAFMYSCDLLSSDNNEPEERFVFNYSFFNEHLLLVPAYQTCEVECGSFFEKREVD